MIYEEEATVFVQPIFDTLTRKITYGELLIRPYSGETPEVWINKLEDKLDFDIHMISKAISLSNITKVRTTVNLTKESISSVELISKIEELLKSNEDNEQVTIELNEYTEYNSEIVMGNINNLHKLGFGIAMDDYGVGNSQMFNLFKVDISIVKFDKMYSGNYNKSLLEIVDAVHGCGKETVIEGIETEKQFNIAQDIGYKNIQGYYLGKPMSIYKFIRIFTNN